MDDDSTLTQTAYSVTDYVLIGLIIEVATCVVVLLACLALVRRGLPAVVGAVGALVAGAATVPALADWLILRDGDGQLWVQSDTGYALVNCGRAVGLVLVGLAAVLAVAGTHRPDPATEPVTEA